MRIGINAVNIRAGGGLNHLKEILLNLDPAMFNIEKVIIWSNKSTITHIPDLKWIKSGMWFIVDLFDQINQQ